MDITEVDEYGRPRDFDDVTMRNHAVARLEKERPYVLIGSVLCGPWSSIMELNCTSMSQEDTGNIISRARRHLKFVCHRYRLQHQAGRYHLHGHTLGARSWKDNSFQQIKEIAQGDVVVIDQ